MFKKPAFRSTLIAATALFAFGTIIAPQSFAQTADGSVRGKTTAGAAVTVASESTGVTRSTTAESNGSFTVSRLPPGRYTVTADGKSVDVLVTIGSSATADFLQELETIEVTANRQRAIDFSSTESNSTFTQEMIQELPIPLDVNAVATLTPTVLRGDAGLGTGDLPSFAGSSVAENAYYINGFDVTNIRNFLSYANLPFEAISQQQVKAGGYGAEYGRSLGGVVSLATKRGTNEWKGGLAFYTTPNSLRANDRNVLSREPTEPGVYTLFDKADKRTTTTINASLGGPIIKDRLFFFANVQREDWDRTDFTSGTKTRRQTKTPTGLVKLDWNIADGHALEFTGIYNKQRTSLSDTDTASDFSTQTTGATRESWFHQGGTVGIAKYTGSFTDNFTASVLVGQVKDLVNIVKGARVADLSCPVVLETNLSEIGCWTGPFPGAPARLAGPLDNDKREAGRVDFEYLLGNHKIRAGVDAQRFESTEIGGSTYSGGHYYRYFVVPANGRINGVAGFTPGSQYVRDRVIQSTSGTFEVENTAYYLEDNWQLTDRVHLYGGLRAESFDNKNGDGTSFVKQTNLIAPRLGLSYQVPVDKPTKLYANAGRYYIPVASNTNIRVTRGELFTQNFFTFTSRNATTQGPVGLSATIGVPQVISDGSLPLPATVADTKLKPMNQDEFILGVQQTQDNGWTVGAKLIYRKLNDGMDDFCGHGAFENYAADQGYDDFDSSLLASCILINPGRDVNLMMDIDASGDLVAQTVPASYFGLAKYTRTYKALELTFEKPFRDRWSVAGSYVLSRSKGTGEGYVSSTINQDDAGITQDFDFGSLTDGANGRLPNDRKHVVKVYGTFGLTDRFSVGANITALSGRPLSCIGFVPPTVPDFADASAYSTASSYYCLDDSGRSKLVPRGSAGTTKWSSTLDLQARYTFDEFAGGGKLTVQADVFNVLNSLTPVELSEQRDFSRQTSNALTNNQLSRNYGLPTAYQTPREARLTVRYSF
jgi:TonB dependent receptor/Carboxypeptidase regulatory-like domain/TonB-dependent Receptor Plug Domain